MNVNLFRYDVNNKTYSMFAQYLFSNEFVTVNLLMLNVKDRFHLSYIKDVEKLTGFMICHKCKNKHGHGNSLNAFYKHVESCDDTFKKKIFLSKVTLPYLPHPFNHKAYLYAFSYNLTYEQILCYI